MSSRIRLAADFAVSMSNPRSDTTAFAGKSCSDSTRRQCFQSFNNVNDSWVNREDGIGPKLLGDDIPVS